MISSSQGPTFQLPAQLAFRDQESGGRRYPELRHPYRNEFMRDRDRVVHTRAFRRLEDKTQVFTPGLSDHFRNRLTHTIEVAQIARTLAHALGLNEDLTEALALVHDIGHPPFAHAGEEELDRQMRVYGDSFDHNLHSLRIVEVLEQRYVMFPGLNLTFEVREGIAKHSRDFAPGLSSQLDEYLPGLRPPLEAQLIDLADEIAYNSADLDDGFSGGLFDLTEIADEVPGYADILDTISTQYAAATEKQQFAETLRALIELLVTGLLQGTCDAILRAGVSTVGDVRTYNSRLVEFEPSAQATNKGLKEFLRKHVYFSPPLIEERERNAARVAELFRFLMSHPERLPADFGDSGTPLQRVVCDYLAGMTDGYFGLVHVEMLGA